MATQNFGLNPEDEAVLEAQFKKALEDGPVVLFYDGEMMGFKDVPSAVAYTEAVNLAAGRENGRLLVVGPNSQAAIRKMIEDDDKNDKENNL